jgi:hypothetical protein
MQPQTEKPIWWRIVVGSLLVIIEVKNHIAPAPNLLIASNVGQQAAMYGVMVAIIVLGCWLIYSGAKPVWRKAR